MDTTTTTTTTTTTNTKPEKIKLVEINSYLTCYLCRGYLIDATTISECLHSFCRSCIIKFLQENCYCPVCEVIINKAKPCLKLDKTLQDIVYKLVPELFVKEMVRRRRFYRDRPELASKCSPEERGDDTERTIFNPQDPISLSIEYISDDSAPGAIRVPPPTPLPLSDVINTMKKKKKGHLLHDNPMKRYLQCPGMCRIEVLKKFVRNKYNVDTNLFHIDILYKRVPLPDHYTLIDIGYIYSWKRNEPMKFFFRITDINKVAERFDYFDGRPICDVIPKPTRTKHHPIDRNRNLKMSSKKNENFIIKSSSSSSPVAKTKSTINKFKVDKLSMVSSPPSSDKLEVEPVKSECVDHCGGLLLIKSEKTSSSPPALIKPEVLSEDLNKKVCCDGNNVSSTELKNSVYTNITLNRDDNIEIITKIEKVSNKEGHPIGLNIINHTVKKTKKQMIKVNSDGGVVDSSSSLLLQQQKPTKIVRFSSEVIVSDRDGRVEQIKTDVPCVKSDREKEEMEKSNFFKSIQLTAKSSPIPNSTRQQLSLPLLSSSPQKRKSSSPIKNDVVVNVNSKERKLKSDSNHKRPVKIIIQPKTIQNPKVRQMVTNVNQNVNSMSKIVDMTTAKSSSKPDDLRKIIDNCKINIPASLSITLNEGGDSGARTPPSIPPVINFIEILKLPGSNKSIMGEGVVITSSCTSSIITTTTTNTCNGGGKSSSSTASTPTTTNIQTFQRIFEDSIKKSPDKGEIKGEVGVKRKILEIASQLHNKKIKGEDTTDAKSVDAELNVPPPKLSPLQLPPLSNQQTSASMHSSSLGLNYTVSVSQPKSPKVDVKTSEVKKEAVMSPTPSLTIKLLSPPPPARKSSIVLNNKQKSKSLSPTSTINDRKVDSVAKTTTTSSSSSLNSNQLLEKYNIQNLAQLTASFNFNPTGQISALQQAMLQHHIERQNWLNNHHQGPLLQYEKYLQSLTNNAQNIKDN